MRSTLRRACTPGRRTRVADVLTSEKAAPSKGTRPDGAISEADASRKVREMFTQIAPRYDLLNHLLSLQLDHLAGQNSKKAAQDPGAAGRGGFGFVLRHRRSGICVEAQSKRADHWRRLCAHDVGESDRQVCGSWRCGSFSGIGCAATAVLRWVIRFGDGGVWVSQSGELRSRASGNATRAQTGRDDRNPGIH